MVRLATLISNQITCHIIFFIGAVQEIKSMIVSPAGKTLLVAASVPLNNRSPKSSSAGSKKSSPKPRFNVFRPQSLREEEGIFFKIYCDDRGKFYKAWGDLKKKMHQNICDRTISDGIIKKFADSDVHNLRKLERDFDIEIKIDQLKGEVRLKGHILDIPNVYEKIIDILKDFKDNESKGKIFDKL